MTAPSGAVNEDTDETVGARPVPVWDDASRAAAGAAATRAVTAFARPDLPYETWWAGVEPLLAPGARQDYAYVDPANVAGGAVTGPAVLLDEDSAYVARVRVPTEAGDYVVVLSRLDGASPWLAERLTLGEGALP